MKVVIDRFEGDFAVCEKDDRTMFNISKDRLPNGAKEGDVLSIIENSIAELSIFQKFQKRKRAADKLMQDIWRDKNQ